VTLAQTVIVLNWLVNFGLPILVAFITNSAAPSAVKALTNIVLSLLSTAIIAVVASLIAGEALDWFQIIFAFVTGFIVSAGSYTHVWKPTGVAPAVALRGVGSGE
jgi:hypothetical protein